MNGSQRPNQDATLPIGNPGIDTETAVVALSEAQKFAAEQRAAAEVLLQQARSLEERLAGERAAMTALTASAESARADERESMEQLRLAREALASVVAARENTIRARVELCSAADAAHLEVATATERLQAARRALEMANTALSEHEPNVQNDRPNEETARTNFDAALQALEERRRVRSHAEDELQAVRARIEPLSGTSRLHSDAAKRVVERRVADTLRRSAIERDASRSETGSCKNPQCTAAASGVPVEHYAGPGQYCPECGEEVTPARARNPAPPARWRNRSGWTLIACGVVVVAAVTGLVIAGITRFGIVGVRVCSTTMTDRVVNEIVHAYTARGSNWQIRYDISRPGNIACDVRFRTATSGPNDAVIAHDGVVAVVNPQNPIARLRMNQLRDVLAGRIVDWSQLGGRPGPIVAAVPDADSDEAQIVTTRLMNNQSYGARVLRTLSAAEIVRFIVSPSGVRSIGIATFSASAPAKIIALDPAPPPNPLSIAANRYPLAVRVMTGSDFNFPSRSVADLIAFTRSPEAQNLVARTNLMSKDGF